MSDPDYRLSDIIEAGIVLSIGVAIILLLAFC